MGSVNHRWFAGGGTNTTVNALERNPDAGHGDKTADLWLGEHSSGARLNHWEPYYKAIKPTESPMGLRTLET